MAERNTHMDEKTYRAMSTLALTELLRRDVRENILDIDTVCTLAAILRERREREDPESIPPVDLEWKSFRENYIFLKAHVRRFFRRILPKLLILLAVLAVIAALLWLGNRPLLTERLTDTVTLEDGAFTVDGLRAGASPAEVTAMLEARHLPWSEGGVEDYWTDLRYRNPLKMFMMPEQSPADITWISIRGSTRITELGEIPVRRTYYFTDGRLTHAELEAEPLRNRTGDSVRCFRLLALAASAAFGEPRDALGGQWEPYDFVRPGTDRVLWRAENGGSLELYGQYTRQSDDTPNSARKTADLFTLYIRVDL